MPKLCVVCAKTLLKHGLPESIVDNVVNGAKMHGLRRCELFPEDPVLAAATPEISLQELLDVRSHR